MFRVLRVLDIQGVHGAGCLVFSVLGAGSSGCSRFCMFRVVGVHGACCSGRSVCWEFRVLSVLCVEGAGFLVLGLLDKWSSVCSGCWVLGVQGGQSAWCSLC